jgi:predicted nucleotidyltransferase
MVLSNEHIKQVITSFFEKKPVKTVWLFGSYARGEADEKSDVDVLVDIDRDAKIGWEYFGWRNELALLMNK